MKILIIDGQGGGVGRALIERLRAQLPEAEILAVGANAIATSAMLKAGATAAATGENSVRVCSRDADVIAGPIGIIMKDAMMGEITQTIAHAVSEAPARKILIPVQRCCAYVAGTEGLGMQKLIEDAVAKITQMYAGEPS